MKADQDRYCSMLCGKTMFSSRVLQANDDGDDDPTIFISVRVLMFVACIFL